MKHGKGIFSVALVCLACDGMGEPLVRETFTEWPAWGDTLCYDFKQQPQSCAKPTRNLPYEDGVYRCYDYGWWSFFVGTNANPVVKENRTAAMEMLKTLDADFAYLSDVMGWPRDLAPQKGYRSAVFLFGSGLRTDDAPNTATGGWQSGIHIKGTDYPIILASYYPVYCFDPSCPYPDRMGQIGAMTHEGIHALFASMPGCRKASWFHEGANCWLQAAMNYARKSGKDYTADDFGWLSMGSILAPFQPIECYSGWLTDGTFGGPAAQGVIGQKPGNVRRLVGGSQYSEVFPTFLGEIVNEKSVPWVWMNCTGYVLEGIARKIGQANTERMIQEYRARLALCDFKRYANAVNHMYNRHLGHTLESEEWSVKSDPWRITPYAATTREQNGWLSPDPVTLPGWTGANIIPITADGESVTVSIKPYGTLSNENNLSLQLCYRSEKGTPVYTRPTKGSASQTIRFGDRKPARGVIFAVICNLDYTYTGNEDIRKNRYDYRIRIDGAAVPADIHTDWFNWSGKPF